VYKKLWLKGGACTDRRCYSPEDAIVLLHNIPCNFTPRMQFQQYPKKVASTGHKGSSSVLIMLVSVVNCLDKKGVMKKKNMNIWTFLTFF